MAINFQRVSDEISGGPLTADIESLLGLAADIVEDQVEAPLDASLVIQILCTAAICRSLHRLEMVQ